MFFRIFNPWPILPRYVQSGDFGIRVNMPSEQYVHKTADYRVNISTNDKGVRTDSSIPYEKANDVVRIVVLGDSFGMGYGVNLEESFTELTRQKLELKTGKKHEVINLSVSGFGTAEHLIMLKNEGLKYSPDIVLSTWHHTDPQENYRSRLFKVENGQLVRDQDTYLPGVKQREFLYRYSAFRFIAENSHLYSWLRERAAGKVKKVLSFISKLKRKKALVEPTESIKEQNAEADLSLMLLKQIAYEAESVGAEFILLNIPRRLSRTTFADTMPSEYKAFFTIVDPTTSFNLHPDKLIYWENSHGHFTPFGCELVADEITQKILD